MAWIAGLNLEYERDFLKNHSENLDDEELKVAERLVELQDELSSPDAEIDGYKIPNFVALSKAKQRSVVSQQLQAIGQSRLKLLEEVK